MEFVEKIREYIDANDLIKAGDRVLVAVSGGADSVALLYLLHSMGNLDLLVAHLNHGLRGEESDGDELFVRRLAADLGLPVFAERADVRALAADGRLSLEDAGRRARYAFFGRIAAEHGAVSVALAHHADDQAETVLMRLLRGAGGTGLAGMSPRSAGRYVRPLLCVTRAEIESYLRERRLHFRVDSSNASNEFLRNRIRNQLLPLLAGYNPAVFERLTATAEIVAADEELLAALTDQALNRLARQSAGSVTLGTGPLRTELKGLRMRLYRRAIVLVKGDLAHISFRHLQDLDRLLFSPKPNARISLPDGITARRSYGELEILRDGPLDEAEWKDPILVPGPGEYLLPGGGRLTVSMGGELPPGLGLGRWQAGFDIASVPFPWLVRAFCPGDRMVPLGMTGEKKVKDIFIDAKVPLTARRRIPLVLCGGNLIWVAGLRVSELTRIKDSTTATVAVRVEGGVANDL